MRTTRKTANLASGNGNITTKKRKYNRKPKTNSHEKENQPPRSDVFQARLKQVSIPQASYATSFVVSAKKESEPSDELPSCQNQITESRPEDVGKAKPEPSTQYLLQQQKIDEHLSVAADRDLNQVNYEIIDTGSHGNNIIEVTDITAHYSEANNGTSIILNACKEEPLSNVTYWSLFDPATCATVLKAENLPSDQSNRKASSFNGPYKLYRFMICEWFYSHIDRPLFAEGYSKNLELGALLNANFPLLFTRSLNRVQWNYIRLTLRKQRPVRRLSHAFFLDERINLERRREKLRFLMENSMIEYLDDDIPSAIPKPIELGSTVRGTSFQPNYGSYTGEVIGVQNRNIPLFLVRFDNGNQQVLPDYRVSLEQSFHLAEASDTVSVTFKHLKQITLLEKKLQEKIKFLHGLENIRLNLAGRHAMGKLDPKQDHEQIERYDQIVRKLLHLNRNLLQLMKQIATDYEQYMSEPLTADNSEDVPVIDKYVVDETNQLLAAYAQVDGAYNSPMAVQLWRETMQRLHKRPEYLQQFEVHLASRIGKLFDTTP
ncbi:uncharacterized protein LOC128309687 [Anopheles moucheti]|uniref:uncharacterized protein LOC128309687 n=1 Tax=Anopheles moucheti TaxID=186751 RepID=UPI0022F03E59|nr:uncharacterized protein LOC128309687 [Anopheles moucheti]